MAVKPSLASSPVVFTLDLEFIPSFSMYELSPLVSAERKPAR